MRKIAWVVLVCMALLFVSCGGSMTPDEMAAKIVEKYEAAMKDLAGLLKDVPEGDVVEPKVAELKEKVIQEMIEIGKEREKLDEATKATVNSKVLTAMMDLQKSTEFKDNWQIMNQAHQHYSGTDNYELSKNISSFNIIMQYAQFELLKKQAPEEAARLGIE